MSRGIVTIIDYGIGNLFSVRRAVEVCGADHIRVSANPADIAGADRVILPGVGAFERGMQGLRERGLIDPLRAHARSGGPLLGICLGMQMLATTSKEFGDHQGLGLIEGCVGPIPRLSAAGDPLKAPFIGWAALQVHATSSTAGWCLGRAQTGTDVYLVHSFHVMTNDPADVLATYDYGGNCITAAIARGNVVGVQFHPEKSGNAGLDILRRFIGATDDRQ